jgi:hypothetical protein
MSLIQIGIVDTTGKLDMHLVAETAAAINVQVTRDLPQFWTIQATVRVLTNPKQIPSGVWPVQLVKSLPPDEGGFHMTKHNQPYAKVIATPQDNSWTVDASHEIIEMLVDPYGNRLQSSKSIKIVGNSVEDGDGEFEYLVEACDPCEDNDFGYSIQGIVVSDFITPHYYDPVATPATRYSFNGSLTAPRQLLKGGYISFVNGEQMQQILWVDPSKPPQLVNLGPAEGSSSLRVLVDNHTDALVRKLRSTNPELMSKAETHRTALHKLAAIRAKHYR